MDWSFAVSPSSSPVLLKSAFRFKNKNKNKLNSFFYNKIDSFILFLNSQPTYEKLPGPGMTQLNFINTLPCPVNVTYRVGTEGTYDQLISLDDTLRYNATDFFPADQTITVDGILQLTNGRCGDLTVNTASLTNADLGNGVEDEGYAVLITLRQNALQIVRLNETEHLKKSDNGNPMIA